MTQPDDRAREAAREITKNWYTSRYAGGIILADGRIPSIDLKALVDAITAALQAATRTQAAEVADLKQRNQILANQMRGAEDVINDLNKELYKRSQWCEKLEAACELALCELDGIGTNVDRGIYHRPAYKALEAVLAKPEPTGGG